MPTFYNYRKPKLVRLRSEWYVEYYYRIPVGVRHLYDDKEWYRFRVRDDINRRRGDDRERYAEWVLKEMEDLLKGGFNPFDEETQLADKEASGIFIPKEINANDALLLFLAKWNQRGLAEESYRKYERFVGRLIDWLKEKGMLYGDVKNIIVEHIEAFLLHNKKLYNQSNREHNNTYDFIRTAFNYLLKKKIIDASPCAGIDKLKSKSSKRRFYDEANLKAITKALLASDPYTYLAFQTGYYLCVRSDKELMNLKVGNIP